MKKLLAAASLVIALGAGCADGAPSATTETTPTPSIEVVTETTPPASAPTPAPALKLPPKKILTATVHYTEGGKFVPESVGVNTGGTITWVNDSVQDIWVASDPHPVHTGLPGFDSKAVIKPGASWSYTFAKTGVFPYHNHMISGQQGLVVITDLGK